MKDKQADETAVRRPKLTGHLYLRGNVWYGRYRLKGKETSFCTGIRNEDAGSRQKAEAVLMEKTSILRIRDRNVQLAALRGLMESASEEAERRFGELNEKKLKDIPRIFKSSSFRIDCSAQQLDRYVGYADALATKFGPETNISAIDETMADQFSKHLISISSPNTYNKYLNGLSLIWNTIGKTVGLKKNPWDAIPRKKLDTHVRRVLTDEEIETLMKTAGDEARRLLALGIYTGLRLGDCCCLKWDCFKDGFIDTVTMKRKRRVVIPILPPLKRMLGEFGKSGYVIPGFAAKYAKDDSNISKRMSSLFRKCGISTSVGVKGKRNRPDCTFHSLRATFITKAIEAGVPPHVVQQIVGHGSPAMTEHYTHLSDKAIIDAFSKIK